VGDFDFTTPEVVEGTAPYTGVYYIEAFAEVDDALGGGVDYTLSVELTTLAACVDDANEDNDDIASATVLAPGGPLSAQSCVADDDCFAITLGAGDGIDVSVDFDTTDGQVDLFLYDDAGVEIDSDTFSPLDVQGNATVAATYYACVAFDSDDTTVGGGVSYDITATIVPGCPADVYEPNDDIASAPTLAPGTYTGLHVCTTVGSSTNPGGDYFAVDLLAGQTLNADVLFIDAEGDIDAQILDAAGTAYVSAGSTSDNEIMTHTAAVDETVYVRVRLWADAGVAQIGNTYDLVLTVN
jgi:hypothetical protein